MTYGAFDSAIEAKVADFLSRNPNLQQAGQANDDAVWDGATACTHTVWQVIARVATGHLYTLNEINALAGMPYKAKAADGSPRGMRPAEAQHLITKIGLPYEIVYGKPFSTLMSLAKNGPVMYAMRYGTAPEWKGFRYNGVTASAPFAIYGGKTQLTGFEDGRHAVLLVGQRASLSSAGVAVTNASGVRLRSGAATTYAILATLAAGTKVAVLGKVTGGAWTVGTLRGTTWWHVTYAGKTGYVATGLLGAVSYPATGTVAYRKEPNHGWPARPEKPPFDIITPAQAAKEYTDYHDRLGQTLYAAVPTRAITFHP